MKHMLIVIHAPCLGACAGFLSFHVQWQDEELMKLMAWERGSRYIKEQDEMEERRWVEDRRRQEAWRLPPPPRRMPSPQVRQMLARLEEHERASKLRRLR